jgi:hypothetical protein
MAGLLHGRHCHGTRRATHQDRLPRPPYQGAPAIPDGVYDLLIDGRLAGRASTPGGNTLTLDMAARRFETAPGEPGAIRFTGLSSQPKNIEIWLPQAEITEPIAMRTVAPVEAPAPSGRRPSGTYMNGRACPDQEDGDIARPAAPPASPRALTDPSDRRRSQNSQPRHAPHLRRREPALAGCLVRQARSPVRGRLIKA